MTALTVEECRRAVLHEVGHHFGISDARLHELGLRVELQGSGRVTRQEPAAGTRVVRGATILLR